MIIQFQYKNPNKYLGPSKQIKNQLQAKKFLKTQTSLHQSDKKSNSIRISLPLRSSESWRRKRYSCANSQASSNSHSLQLKNETVSLEHKSFKPAFEPRRTCGNVKFLIEVVHKKVRAKTIENSFQHYNYELDMNVKQQKGFKGAKLSPYSVFKITKNKNYAQLMKNQQKGQMHGQQKECKQKDKSIQHSKCKNESPLCHKQKQKIQQIKTQIQILQSFKAKGKRGKFNGSLNIYRKRFRQMKERQIKSHLERDSKLFSNSEEFSNL